MLEKSQQHAVDKTRELQRKLYLAAKKSRNRRFHALYDRIYRFDVLWRAWEEVKANRGSAGVDGTTIGEIEQQGAKAFIERLSQELREGKYQPVAVRRVHIPKPDGRKRPLGIPTVKDRVVQQACKIVIEPIFEANFQNSSYGFRPKRSAHQAVAEVDKDLVKKWRVIDADIERFFDTIDHELLMELVRRRISDGRVLKLIKQWLKAGVMESGRTTPTDEGTPQGGVISPLLANIYLHVMDMYWQRDYAHLGKLIRYADDFVVLCYRREEAEEAMKGVERILKRLKLKLHPQKTRIVDMNEEGFEFLGFRFRKHPNKRTKKLVPLVWPSTKSMSKVRQKVKEWTGRRMLTLPVEEIVKHLNPVIRGWRNYFRAGHSTAKFQALDRYVAWRMKRWMEKKQGRLGSQNWSGYSQWKPHSNLETFYQTGICRQTL
jgi:group II intron reverse transcriptase/maturase